MKRKVGLFLFAVMVAITLGATGIVSLVMYRLVSDKQVQEIRSIEASLAERFGVFETLLRAQHGRIAAHMQKVLPEIVAELATLGVEPLSLSATDLDTLTKKYGVEYIYFIDRSYRIFQTNLAQDLNLVFQPSPLTRFLDTVYGQGTVRNDGIEVSAISGTLQTYSYYGPKDKNYIVETSTDLRNSLSAGDFGWMGKFFFEDFFSDALRSNEYVKDLDIFLINSGGSWSQAWSLLHVGKKLDPAIAERVATGGRHEMLDPGGRRLTVYSRYEAPGDAGKKDPVSGKIAIRQITYDIGLAGDAVVKVVASSLVVLTLMLPIVFWIASRLLQKQLLDPLFKLRGEAGAIIDGDLDHAIGDTDRRDEIGHLARSFAAMRDAVRRTIGDLKETNVSIGRFVPESFLSMIDKPSILSVSLGDNKRREMTVLFSDIRNFTTLSESMTPDENFAFINSFLERMGPVIRSHNGFIDKYIGDAIMALFETPDDAMRASLAMVDALEAFNAERRNGTLPPVAMGIGLNTGMLMLGTIGEKHRMDGTVISDAVNLASRIESLTKSYEIGILISQHTYDRLADPKAYSIRPIDIVVVKGKTEPVALFEVFDRDAPAVHAAKRRTSDFLLAGMVALKGADLSVARDFFEKGLALAPADPAPGNLLKHCAA